MKNALVPINPNQQGNISSNTASMLPQAPSVKAEESTKVYVGKIPSGTSNEFMERLLKVR